MNNIKILVEQVLLAEDHLTLDDKPEAAQSLEFTHDGHTFKGWIDKQGEENHVVMFKTDDEVDMYIEETCSCDDGAKALIVQMIKTLSTTEPKPEADEGTDAPVNESADDEDDKSEDEDEDEDED